MAHRAGTVAGLVLIGALGIAGCAGGGPEEPDLARPSAECEEAFAAAEEAGERDEPDSPRSPDLDLLRDTLDACERAEEWMTAARGHAGALPLEMDRETALDRLCVDHEDTPVCEDWTSSGSGAGEG